jgi:predicted esterase
MILYSLHIFPKGLRALFIGLLLFISCNKSDSPVEPEILSRGSVVSTTSLGTYNVAFIKALLVSAAGAQSTSINLVYDVDAYKVVYKTIDWNGNIVNASGVIFTPKGKNNLSLISLQHGTQTKRLGVGSVNALNSPDGMIGASLGYYTLVPDYLGLGESNLFHPYHYAKSSADPIIDIIRAARNFAGKNNITLNGQVFLAGYSEGGYVTLAAHKEIQEKYGNEIGVTASAPMAGAYDLNLTAKKIFQGKIYNQPSYLAFFVAAYNTIYGWNKLGEFFNSPYTELMPALFDGSKTTDEINKILTNDTSVLFKQNFIAAYLAGTEATLTTAFTSNSLLNWVPTAPVRFFHGDADEYVPHENSVKARDVFLALGANVSLITIPGGTHQSAALPSIIGAIDWFDQIRLKKMIAQN